MDIVDVDKVKPVGKELVFDLDLQDNPWISGEKSDMQNNDRFMPLLFASAAILKAVLEEVYGFKLFMLVYSGRRGVHMYVLDRRAFLLTAEQRSALCESISLRSQCRDSHFCNTNLWPSLRTPGVETAVNAAWAVAMGTADGECNMLSSKADVARFAQLFAQWKPSPVWKAPPPPMKSNEVFTRLCTESTTQDRIDCLGKLNRFAARDVVLSVVWPRLDVQVTANMQHTTKTPFSLHAATLRVAVPVPFDAFKTPAVEGGWRPAAATLGSWRGSEAIRASALAIMRRSVLLVEYARVLEKKRDREKANLGEQSQIGVCERAG